MTSITQRVSRGLWLPACVCTKALSAQHVSRRVMSTSKRDGIAFHPFTRPSESITLTAQLERLIADSQAIDKIRIALTPLQQEQMLRIKALKEQGDVPLAVVTPKNVLGGMRGIPSLVWEISQVDSKTGISYRGFSLDRCVESLPKCNGANMPCAEGLLWLLLTGRFPSEDELETMRIALLGSPTSRKTAEQMLRVVDSIPADVHPMTQFIVGILAAQSSSEFAAEYHSKQMTKDSMWQPVLADGLHLLAHLPVLAAFIYRRCYKPETLHTFRQEIVDSVEAGWDWVRRMTTLMGLEHPEAADVMRLYALLHADHEGGNVSAHLAHVVASAHSDIFYAYGAALCGLAGPLHGLASQDSLQWQMKLKEWLETDKGLRLADDSETNKQALRDAVREYAEAEYASGRVIPGFGHAVLRTMDPRYKLLKEWGAKYAPDSDIIRLNQICCSEISNVLSSKEKVSSPWPNVDCGSGAVLQEIGIKETEFYTVLFGCSRAMGITASTVWARLLKLPIERPKSVTLDGLEKMVRKARSHDSVQSR